MVSTLERYAKGIRSLTTASVHALLLTGQIALLRYSTLQPGSKEVPPRAAQYIPVLMHHVQRYIPFSSTVVNLVCTAMHARTTCTAQPLSSPCVACDIPIHMMDLIVIPQPQFPLQGRKTRSIAFSIASKRVTSCSVCPATAMDCIMVSALKLTLFNPQILWQPKRVASHGESAHYSRQTNHSLENSLRIQNNPKRRG